MKTVHEVSVLSGVSVRTLHHYDAIGLLKPTKVTEAGYRLYDDRALERLHSILLFRELQFPLREIKTILDNPDFDRKAALTQQIRLLELQKEHIEGLILSAREMMNNGGDTMSFTAFDKSEMEQYAAEAKKRWGGTEAYRQSQKKSPEEQAASGGDMLAIFGEFGAIRTADPASREAQALAEKLQRFITAHYYDCTKEILGSLGQMYVADERFRENIDRAGGPGTAEFVSRAIDIYCR